MLKHLKDIIDRAMSEKNTYEQLVKKQNLEQYIRARTYFENMTHMGKKGTSIA